MINPPPPGLRSLRQVPRIIRGGGGRGGGQGKTLELFVNVRQLRQKVEIERISSTFRERHTISTSVLITLTRDVLHKTTKKIL